MPYTPPSQQSPVASKGTSPVISRSNSYVAPQPLPQHVQVAAISSSGTRPQLPRSSSSTSYIHRHRRSPSMTSPPVTFKDGIMTETPDSTPVLVHFPEHRITNGISSNVRQSPPPVNDLSVPTGAVISPPDSAQNSSDDEETSRQNRANDLVKLAAAFKVIEQNRDGSPTRLQLVTSSETLQLGLKIPTTEGDAAQRVAMRPAFSTESRKISHSRSATESAIIDIDRSSESPDRSADSDLEDEMRVPKPPMLRKKSGELVRPALRGSSAKKRPSSMPGTPTYSKAVHFDSHLEHVRHFLQVDRPLAVSANTSPNDVHENESEFPFGEPSPGSHWEIKLANFPANPDPSPRAIKVERIFLAADNKTLVGTVAVQNLAFHKSVVARFTIDYWKTTSEVTAEFNHDVRRANTDNLDRFNFNIKLDDLANMENRSLFFCVRYSVNGQEFWDSNNNFNYQVDFTKKSTTRTPQHGSSQSLSALPRSRPSPPTSSRRQRPKSASAFDDFAHALETGFDQNGFALHDTPIKFRNKPSQKPSPTLRPKMPGQAFGNRYDFGASLSAAISAATTVTGDKAEPSKAIGPIPGTLPRIDSADKNGSLQPASLTAGKPAIQSQSYNELIDKYCFFGSSKGAMKHHQSGQAGIAGEAMSSTASSPASSANISPAPSPPAEGPLPVKMATTSRPSVSPSARLERTSNQFSHRFPYQQSRSGGIFPEATTPPAITS